MTKQTCWFGWFKRLFVRGEEKPNTEKKSKRWRWFSIGSVKCIKGPERRIEEATEKQRKYAVSVAIATAAAAEAAVAAAQAAAEFVKLTASSHTFHHNPYPDPHFAATKIQSTFRGYLARKALRALKGVVRLQAIVRGQAVRRRLRKSMSLVSKVKKPSHLQPKPISDVHGICKQINMESKLECKSQRCWDYSALSKEDIETLCFRKQEANLKRDRMMKYSFSHRERRNNLMLEESLPNKEVYTREGMENFKDAPILNLSTMQVKTRSPRKQDSIEGLYSPVSFPRRSFCRTQRTTEEDDSSICNSPVFPTYMAATESAKAKARSSSTPRQRVGTRDAWFDPNSSYKNGIPFWYSYNGNLYSNYDKSSVSQHIPMSFHHHY